MTTEPTQERDPGSERLVKISEEDKRKLYALLDADLPTRARRMELGIVALFVMSGSQVAALLGGPNPVTALWGLIF